MTDILQNYRIFSPLVYNKFVNVLRNLIDYIGIKCSPLRYRMLSLLFNSKDSEGSISGISILERISILHLEQWLPGNMTKIMHVLEREATYMIKSVKVKYIG